MLTCSKCKKLQLLTEYNPKKSGKRKFSSHCKTCIKEYQKKRHQETKDIKKKKRRQIFDFIANFKTTNPCKDCGKFLHHCAMDFDHLGEKNFLISLAPRSNIPMHRILNEMSLCDLVCSNCHRLRTYQRKKSKQ